MQVWRLAVDTSRTHSDWQTVYYIRRTTMFFSAAQTSSAFRSEHVLPHVDAINENPLMFTRLWIGNKCVKFRFRIHSNCYENDKET